MTETRYDSPLGTRYASPAMQQLWSASHRAGIWRRLWLALARAQRDLGLAVPADAVAAIEAHLDDADLDEVRVHEQRLRHDVMAHVHHLGEQAPAARPWIHLGATSCFVTDNADLVVMRDALGLLLGRLANVLHPLTAFALQHADRPTVAYTHFQPAQLTTVGKRATLWLHDFALDAEALLDLHAWLPFRGCKGTTGTQASFLELFDGDHDRVRALDERVTAAFGFARSLPVTGQTYTRKVDARVLDVLSGVAQTCAKFGNDLRLLQHEGEVLEPAEAGQVGSSAMPYKRNPMRAERLGALARYLISLQANPAYTAATQWLERTLDDSANRRIALPDAFLATDALLLLAANIGEGLEVRGATIERHVTRAMPFMATERWLMLGVKAGGDRQHLHETIRAHAWSVAEGLEQGRPNDLLDRLAADAAFAAVGGKALRAEMDPVRYIGRAPEQVREFVAGTLAPLIERLAPHRIGDRAGVHV